MRPPRFVIVLPHDDLSKSIFLQKVAVARLFGLLALTECLVCVLLYDDGGGFVFCFLVTLTLIKIMLVVKYYKMVDEKSLHKTWLVVRLSFVLIFLRTLCNK